MNEQLRPIVDIKTDIDKNNKCEIEIIPFFEFSNGDSCSSIAKLDQRLSDLRIQLNGKDGKINELESKADGLDYAVAAACGIITGLLDAFFVGEFSLESANKWGTEKCNKFVEIFANTTIRKDPNQKHLGSDYAFGNPSDAVRYLERKYCVNYDAASTVLGQGDHHLNDYAHHPSLFGLIISIVSQLGESTLGRDDAGVLRWVNVSNSNAMLKGNNVFEKLFYAISNWACHLISDMVGSSGSIAKGNAGTGIPGPILSMLQESAGIFKNNEPDAQAHMQKWLNNLFRGRLKGQNGVPFDLRTELGIGAHLGKQALVVEVNESIIMGFYFARHLIIEIKAAKIKSFKEMEKINWNNTLPFKNRTVIRMLTVSLSTMTAIDAADAAVRAVANGHAFLAAFVVRINYLGLMSTIISCGWDVVMGTQLTHNRNERIELLNDYVGLNNAKVFYKQGDLWLALEETEKFINNSIEVVKQNQQIVEKNLLEIKADLVSVSNSIKVADKKNAGLKDEIMDILDWRK
ncbi:MAG: hypothetical protein EOM74_00455 [Methanomicrobia archaeon]|nr:hypothetical protein [Methanomicrobia archaeon]